MAGEIEICQESRKHEEREEKYCPWLSTLTASSRILINFRLHLLKLPSAATNFWFSSLNHPRLNGANEVQFLTGSNPIRNRLESSNAACLVQSSHAITQGWRKSFSAIMVAALGLGFPITIIANDGPGTHFIVHGSVLHEQFGSHPMRESYHFIARSDGCQWSISTIQEPKGLIDEALAVGNDQGVFITFDLTSSFQKAYQAGKTKAINNAQAVAMTNVIPNCTLAPCLGPIWLTYLSSCYLKTADASEMPAPVSLNVAGGNSLPLFDAHPQKSSWLIESTTGLPVEFHSLDTGGFVKGMTHGQLVNLQKYPAPFDKGFTNINFRVMKYVMFQSASFPQMATMEVFWVNNSNLERIHRFSMVTEQYDPPPPTPIAQPTTKGIAVITDGRLVTTNGPIILQYLGTNRFLKSEELTNLPGFKEAVKLSLNRKTPIIANMPAIKAGVKWIVVSCLVISSLLIIIYSIRHTQTK